MRQDDRISFVGYEKRERGEDEWNGDGRRIVKEWSEGEDVCVDEIRERDVGVRLRVESLSGMGVHRSNMGAVKISGNKIEVSKGDESLIFDRELKNV